MSIQEGRPVPLTTLEFLRELDGSVRDVVRSELRAACASCRSFAANPPNSNIDGTGRCPTCGIDAEARLRLRALVLNFPVQWAAAKELEPVVCAHTTVHVGDRNAWCERCGATCVRGTWGREAGR